MLLASCNEKEHPQIARVRRYLSERYSCFETLEPETAIDECVEWQSETEFQRWRVTVRNILGRSRMPRHISRKEFIGLCMSLMMLTGQLED